MFIEAAKNYDAHIIFCSIDEGGIHTLMGVDKGEFAEERARG